MTTPARPRVSAPRSPARQLPGPQGCRRCSGMCMQGPQPHRTLTPQDSPVPMQHSGDTGDGCQVEKQHRCLRVFFFFILFRGVLRLSSASPQGHFHRDHPGLFQEHSGATWCPSVFIANTGAACQPRLQAPQLPPLPGARAQTPAPPSLPLSPSSARPWLTDDLLGRPARGEDLGA